MIVYAGIDEAGYGPMFGPLVIGRAVLGLPGPAGGELPDLWRVLGKAVCRRLKDRRGRIAVNDSKQVHNSASANRLKHLERGVLSFAALAGHEPATVGELLDCLGGTARGDVSGVPWYEPADEVPWAKLPVHCTAGEIAVSQNLLLSTARQLGVRVVDMGAAVVFEGRFNQMVAATRSKAAASFTFVAGHLAGIWQRFGKANPMVIVDRQSGRTHYREQLALIFPGAQMQVLDESALCSVYRLASDGLERRSMTVRFETDSEDRHLPTALASMISKYARELLMLRFQGWFTARVPQVKATAGYGADAKRFWLQIQPHLSGLGIAADQLRRIR